MERIVIRSSNWLGDAVMSVPAVRAIKRGLAGAHVAVLTPEKLADVWRLVPEVDEVIPFPAAKGSGLMRTLSGMAHIFRVAKRIRGRGFTTGVVFPNSLRTGLEMWLARIPRRVGYPGHARRSLLLTQVLREEKSARATAPSGHQVFHYLRLAESLGARVEPDAAFGFPKAGSTRVRLPGAPVRIAVCAGAEYGPAKRWLPEGYAEVVQAVSHATTCRWQFVGTAKDRPVATEIATLCENPPNVENLCGETTLGELIGILRESDALLTNDTGTMHLAALLGVRTVAIFGSTEPALTGPLGSGHTVVRKRAECSPCFLRECPIDFRCMREITAASVIAAVREALGLPASA
jgi:lipopolysaccharide heptosyltransferase II